MSIRYFVIKWNKKNLNYGRKSRAMLVKMHRPAVSPEMQMHIFWNFRTVFFLLMFHTAGEIS